ncbi:MULTISPECIES: CBS domain-containing protein [Spirulina sp. CCY15215]|uniref:CBS domain-containing protein n=1 Tax=Spirulina sp. CCY15215 TaxID=2767591 RepID=UPI001951B2CA|nr:CBS domain-containing protein [Spirulina major]
MDVILCHQTADFDALGAAVGLTRLKPGAKVVLTGGAHPGVRDFLALYRDEFATIERRSVNLQQVRGICVVDTQKRDRLGLAAEWLDLPHLKAVEVYDHHLNTLSDIPATYRQIEAVGATTTLIVERLQQADIALTPPEATVMALGIHLDTASLTSEQTTPRDALALAWLMKQGVMGQALREYLEPGLSRDLQKLLSEAIERLETRRVFGYCVAWVLLKTDRFIPGLSSLTERLIDLTEADLLLVGGQYFRRNNEEGERVTVIGRSRIPRTNLARLFAPFQGGGHPQAASVSLKDRDGAIALNELVEGAIAQIPEPLTARELMSSPVRTIRPRVTIDEAQRILLRYGHSGLCVVDEGDRLVGIISRRDLDIALHHGFAHAPVKGYMSRNLKTIIPKTPLPEIEALMITYDLGRLPVIEGDRLVGIVTRTDVLRQSANNYQLSVINYQCPDFYSLLSPQIVALLALAVKEAEKRGWHLYLVGGAVRDILLREEGTGKREEGREENLSITNNPPEIVNHQIQDLDLVVDGFHETAEAEVGVTLGKVLQQHYPAARLEVHGAFQTAALLWHKDPEYGSLAIDIATARTEFYPYPAANPEVEASDLRQDLYRRDFTINALALRLTNPRSQELLDFFGGLQDLRSRQIRVLHANSFIEDPTRIYRAVRFAVRLGFTIESQTEDYIRYALESGVYDRRNSDRKVPALTTRLKTELKYILQAPYWYPALKLIASLGALRCLHPTLKLDRALWWQIRFLDRALGRFDPENHLLHWQMRLEILLSHLPSPVATQVAANLQLTADSLQRLSRFTSVKQQIIADLTDLSDQTPSAIFKILRQYKTPMLALLVVQTPRNIRRKIWRYLTCWSQMVSPLNGNDLKQLGYKPGPQYKQIIDDLFSATLDGIVGDRADAEAFLHKYYELV